MERDIGVYLGIYSGNSFPILVVLDSIVYKCMRNTNLLIFLKSLLVTMEV